MSLVEKSPIQNFYHNTRIFITGASGFLGTALLEKLIRSCPDIKRIYLLMRNKRNKTTEQRLEEIFEDHIWDKVKKQNLKYRSYVKLIDGELMSPKLGISDEDYTELSNEVNIIFHLAATIKFDEPLKKATKINVEGTKNVLELAKKCRNLNAVVYVSTAFSQCVLPTLEESFYEPQRDPEEFIAYCDKLSDEELNDQTLSIIGNYPNTYTFTKSLAENMVKKYENELPIAISRPSSVFGCIKEPIEGWCKGKFGAVGVMMGVALGILRVMPCSLDSNFDIIPADFCVNQLISIAYETSKHEKKNNIYNCVSGSDNPVSWRELWRWSISFGQTYAFNESILFYFILFSCNKYLLGVYQLLFHSIPAYIIDIYLWLTGRKPMLVKVYKKIHKMMRVLHYFCVNSWVFYSDNSRQLYENLDPRDQELFPFNFREIEWDKYLLRANKYIQTQILKKVQSPMNLQHKL